MVDWIGLLITAGIEAGAVFLVIYLEFCCFRMALSMLGGTLFLIELHLILICLHNKNCESARFLLRVGLLGFGIASPLLKEHSRPKKTSRVPMINVMVGLL